jgi:hypothetical protein
MQNIQERIGTCETDIIRKHSDQSAGSTDYMDMINMDVGITNSKSPVHFHSCQLSIMSVNSIQRAIITHLEASENLPASAPVFR